MGQHIPDSPPPIPPSMYVAHWTASKKPNFLSIALITISLITQIIIGM